MFSLSLKAAATAKAVAIAEDEVDDGEILLGGLSLEIYNQHSSRLVSR